MAVFDIAQWCAEMLVDTGSATEQPGAASSSMASTPAPALPPVARVPMSDGLEAVVVLDDSTDPCPAVNAASQQRVDTVSVDPSLLQGPFVSEPVAHPGFVAWQADPVYRAWLPHIETPIAPLKQLCGQQVRPLVCATLFGGGSHRSGKSSNCMGCVRSGPSHATRSPIALPGRRRTSRGPVSITWTL